MFWFVMKSHPPTGSELTAPFQSLPDHSVTEKGLQE